MRWPALQEVKVHRTKFSPVVCRGAKEETERATETMRAATRLARCRSGRGNAKKAAEGFDILTFHISRLGPRLQSGRTAKPTVVSRSTFP